MASTSMPQHPSDVKMVPSTKRTEYEQSMKIILGTIGAMLGFVLLSILICLLFKKRNNRSPNIQMPLQSFLGDTSAKEQHCVLLIYSYDCPSHANVIEELGNYLSQTFGFYVFLDLWDESGVAELGIHSWYEEKLATASLVLIVCSTGARLKCRPRPVEQKSSNSSLPDIFSWAVSVTAESMRQLHQSGDSLDKFAVIYFEYSSPQDIPPKLDKAQQFCLMKDLSMLASFLQESRCYSDQKSNSDSECSVPEKEGLTSAIEDANSFIKSNPNWVEECLEIKEPSECSLVSVDSITTSECDRQMIQDIDFITHFDSKSKMNLDVLQPLMGISKVDNFRHTVLTM